MSELDKQIFDAAPELEGLKKEMHNLWGVVGVDENGKITKYWDYMEYNYDRGEWREVIGEVDGHLVVKDSKGVESIIYPERITINVNGEEITLNTTARGYTENIPPSTTEEYIAFIDGLSETIQMGDMLSSFGEEPLTLSDLDFWGKYNQGAEAANLVHIRSNKWQEKESNELPMTPVVFPLVFDGEVVDGIVLVPVIVVESDGDISGWWGWKIIERDGVKYPPVQMVQMALDNGVYTSGGNSALLPMELISLEVCLRGMEGMGIMKVCQITIEAKSQIRYKFAQTLESGKVALPLKSGELIAAMSLSQLSK